MVKTYTIVLLICYVLSISFSANASFVSNEKVKPEYLTSCTPKLSDFINITSSDMIKITGKKMSLFDRISFSQVKLSMRKALKKNPDLSVSDYFSTRQNKNLGPVSLFLIISFGFLLILSLILVIAWSNSSFH